MWNLFFLFTILFLALSQSFASTYPGAGSSLISDPDLGAFLAPLGFTVKTEGTTWRPIERPQSEVFESYRLGPKGQKSHDTFLALRSDKIPAKINLESYAKKWLRDYPQYGFEYLGTKSITMQGSPGLVVDFIQKEKNKQIRQVILQKGEQIAVFTCTDKKEEFSKTLMTCNKIIRSFEWTEN